MLVIFSQDTGLASSSLSLSDFSYDIIIHLLESIAPARAEGQGKELIGVIKWTGSLIVRCDYGQREG
jgi:hypothetical protein